MSGEVGALPPGESRKRACRGWISRTLSIIGPAGRFVGRSRLRPLLSAERQDRGLVLILPGIEGESFLAQSAALGLADAGVDCAIEVFDWTTGFAGLFLYHLAGWRRNLRQAQRVANRVVEYQAKFPGRPVTIMGHSGGGAMAVLAIERLPADVQIERAILLLAAISPGYPLGPALAKTRQGIWNFSSVHDWFFLNWMTCLFGTIDRRHSVSAGSVGFAARDWPPSPSEAWQAAAQGLSVGPSVSDASLRIDAALSSPSPTSRLVEVPWAPPMRESFNCGGHLGPVNRVFAAEWLAPIVLGGDLPAR